MTERNVAAMTFSSLIGGDNDADGRRVVGVPTRARARRWCSAESTPTRTVRSTISPVAAIMKAQLNSTTKCQMRKPVAVTMRVTGSASARTSGIRSS